MPFAYKALAHLSTRPQHQHLLKKILSLVLAGIARATLALLKTLLWRGECIVHQKFTTLVGVIHQPCHANWRHTQIFQRWPGGQYKGPAKGLKGGGNGIPSYPIPKGGKGNRGRDHADDARNVRQKSWNKDGKSVAEDWSRSHSVHSQFRMLPLEAVETLLETFSWQMLAFNK
jgi:hypothetical protein